MADFFLLRLSDRMRKLLPLLVIAGMANFAHGNGHDEASLKTGFLKGFIEFVEWPRPQSTLSVCGIGDDQLGEAMNRLTGKVVRKSALVVRRQVGPESWLTCDVIYISAQERRHIDGLVAATRGRPILLVADLDGAAQLGVAFSLFPRSGGYIGFDVNHAVAQQGELKISAKLLRLARRVH